MELSIEIIAKAMIFRHHHAKTRFSYIDCFGYTYARENKMLFLTGDRAFQGMNNVKIIRYRISKCTYNFSNSEKG